MSGIGFYPIQQIFTDIAQITNSSGESVGFDDYIENNNFSSFNADTITNSNQVFSNTGNSVLSTKYIAAPLFINLSGGGNMQKEIFIATSSWTVPTGITTIYVTGTAGGGSGANNIAATGSGGGSSGASCLFYAISVTSGHILDIVIGAGGAAAGGGSTGNLGGNTTITDTTSSTQLLLLAGGSTAPTANNTVGIVSTGSSGLGSGIIFNGTPGMPGAVGGAGANYNVCGAGGGTIFGPGAPTFASSGGGLDIAGISAAFPGGGGGGGWDSGSDSGAGGTGIIIIEY